MESEFARVERDELASSGFVIAMVDGQEVLVALTKCGVLAVKNECTHALTPLDAGTLFAEQCEIECPLHGGRFDLRTGEPIAGPPIEGLKCYSVSGDEDDFIIS